MVMHKVTENSDGCLKTSGCLWQYCRNKSAVNNANGDVIGFNVTSAITNSFLNLNNNKKTQEKQAH